jgi:hypothetical protein
MMGISDADIDANIYFSSVPDRRRLFVDTDEARNGDGLELAP